MQTIWDINKQDPEKARIEKQQKQKEISKKVSDIRTKLKAGKKLSAKEMRLLREHAPDLYKKAEAVQQERKNFKEALKNCKTKDEVQRLFSQKMELSMTVAKQDQELGEYMAAAMQDEHTNFAKSDDYKSMKWESECNTENKAEKVSKTKKGEKTTKSLDEMYEEVLQRAEQITARFDVSQEGVVSEKQQTNTEPVKNSYPTISETTQTENKFTKKV